MKTNYNISNIDELNAELISVEGEIRKSNLAIIEHGKKLAEVNLSLFSKSGLERKFDGTGHPLSEIVPEATAILLEKTIFSRMGFLGRKALGRLSRVLVKKMFNSNKRVESLIGGKQKEDGMGTLPAPDCETPSGNIANAAIKNHSTGPAGSPVVQPPKLISFKGIFKILKSAISGFSEHKVTKLSGSLAYYTVFSMAPLLVVIISLSAIFFDREAAEGQVFAQLKGLLGPETAMQLQELIRHAAVTDKGNIAFAIGIVTLILGATGIFADIQDSINFIWGIKPKPKKGWLKMLQNRFLSFSVIVSLGFLLVVSLGVSALLDGFSTRLQSMFSEVSVVVFYILNVILTLGIMTTIFGVIFKVLPDAQIRWKDVFSGAIVTALLFMAGKFGISFYISQSNVGGTYGAAGSLVVLLLWTYYSSIILYFGAEFTKVFAIAKGADIRPNHYAVTVREIEVEKGSAPVTHSIKEKQG